jgi:hypothetical protein
VLAATNTGTPPMLLPLPQLSQSAGGPGAYPRSAPAEGGRTARVERLQRSDSPSLPFSGFSVLALVLAGIASITAGRRLSEAVAVADGATDEPGAAARRAAEPLVAEPLRRQADPLRLQAERQAAGPARSHNRAPLYVGAALFAVAAVTAARSR